MHGFRIRVCVEFDCLEIRLRALVYIWRDDSSLRFLNYYVGMYLYGSQILPVFLIIQINGKVSGEAISIIDGIVNFPGLTHRTT